MSASIISPNNSLDLTFGVEIECIVKVSKAQLARLYDSPLYLGGEDEDRVHEVIYHQLIEGGILCFPTDSREEKGYDRWTIAGDSSIRMGHRDADDRKHGYFPVELVSRILRPTQEGFQEIEKVLDLIKSLFSLKTNTSTGLHVHVGNRNDEFPFPTLKKFALTVVAFEHIIHSIHPDDRVDGSIQWCQPPSWGFKLKGLQHYERLSKIESCEDVGDVVNLMNANFRRECAYNFQNLYDTDSASKNFKQTIEFRQHAGSCDFEEISSWVNFAIGLVHYCHKVPRATHLALCSTKSRDPSFTVLDLMRVMDRSCLIDFYETRLHLRPRSD